MTFVSSKVLDSINSHLSTNYSDRVFISKYDRYGINVKYYFKDGRAFDVCDSDVDSFVDGAFSVLSDVVDDYVLSSVSLEFIGYSKAFCEVFI